MKIEQHLNFVEMTMGLETNLYLNSIAQCQCVSNKISVSDDQAVQHMDEYRDDEILPLVIQHCLYLNSIKKWLCFSKRRRKMKIYFMRYKLTHT